MNEEEYLRLSLAAAERERHAAVGLLREVLELLEYIDENADYPIYGVGTMIERIREAGLSAGKPNQLLTFCRGN